MKKYSGYSLVEMMVALVVLGILMTVGVPKMLVFFEGNRMVANANDLLAGLHIARSEAIKTGFRVSICKSSNADTAAPTCDTAATWDQGWFVFEEGKDAGNAIGQYTSADGAVLRVNTGVEGDDVTITTNSSSIANYVSFTSRGVPKLGGGGSQSGVFRICDSRGMTNAAGNVVARGVVLNVSGRARTTNDATKIGACS